MRTLPARRRPVSPVLALAAVLIFGGVLAGCGDDEVALPAPKESNERPESGSSGEGSDADSEYCQAVADLEASDASQLEDPAAAVEALSALGDVAPSELREPFRVLARVAEELGALDGDDMESANAALEIILDPDVQAAAEAIDEYTKDVCGIDLDEDPAESPVDDPDAPVVDPGTPNGDIDLKHIDEIKDSSTGTWVAKLSSTSIVNDTAVTLIAEDYDPVTVDEALEACEVVRSALVEINPQVTIEIENGDTPIVASPAGGSCAAV